MIISAFAGSGKTTAEKEIDNAIDLESSDFQWTYPKGTTTDVEERKGILERKKNPNFVKDYVDSIDAANESYDYIFISSQPSVLEELESRNIPYSVAYPSIESKNEYIERYKNRGNNAQFIKLMDKNFETFVNSMRNNEKAVHHIQIKEGQYLLDAIIEKKRSE